MAAESRKPGTLRNEPPDLRSYFILELNSSNLYNRFEEHRTIPRIFFSSEI